VSKRPHWSLLHLRRVHSLCTLFRGVGRDVQSYHVDRLFSNALVEDPPSDRRSVIAKKSMMDFSSQNMRKATGFGI